MARWVLIALLVVACRTRTRPHENTSSPAPPALPSGPRATSCPDGTVMTTGGCVRGDGSDVIAYRGIPYAAPPVGALRWRLPQPAATWPGVRDARAFGPACPQRERPDGTAVAWNEDCLTLNVWTPKGATKLPVMVWIHGGGLVQGASSQPIYDGSQFAAAGVVLVSFNYRLGALGFLAHPALEGAGNYGLHDQIAALRWVRDNVAAFGGDPANVTIFGESAGGESVCALMASPRATGLFGKGIIESAQCVDYGKPLRRAGDEQGPRIAKSLGCDGGDVAACLRAKTPEQILGAAPSAVGFLGKGEHFGFTVDGTTLPDAPRALLEAGKLPAIPMIVGTTTDEGTLFTTQIRRLRELGYRRIVKKMFRDRADDVLAAYPPADPKQAFDALVTDVVFTCPTRTAARALRGPVYRYVFSYVTDKAREKGMGATHASELPFVFDTQASPTPAERELARTMLHAWAQFAKTGEPGGTWPRYDAATDNYLDFATPIAVRTGMRTAKCDLLDRAHDVTADED